MDKGSIIKMYFEDKMTPLEIAKKVNRTKQYICMVLKADSRYEGEKTKRILGEKDRIKKQTDDINFYYYKMGLKPYDIAQMVGISPASVTEAIKKNKSYHMEKNKRKSENKRKNNEQTKAIMANKRKSKASNSDDAVIKNLLLLQQQNAVSMSRSRKISENGIVALNLNHYTYNPKKERLEFDDRCGKRPDDLPKTKKVHEPVYVGKAYEDSFENKIFA